jgi:hypothetical protein
MDNTLTSVLAALGDSVIGATTPVFSNFALQRSLTQRELTNREIAHAGDANHFPASDAPLTQMLVDFSVSFASMNTPTINPGGSASYSITLGPVIPATTLPGPIALSASGGPAGATYAFSHATVPGNAGLTSETFTVTVPSVVSAFKPPSTHAIPRPYGWLVGRN